MGRELESTLRCSPTLRENTDVKDPEDTGIRSDVNPKSLNNVESGFNKND